MTMSEPYDLIALGTGTAAKKVALACREAGWRVAIVDCLPFGGTCALRGCDPKKALWSVAQAFSTVESLQAVEAGILADELRLDWGRMMAFKRRFTEPVPHKRETQFREHGIDAFHGFARFTGRNTIAIGNEQFEARHILIATGAKSRPLTFAGAEHLTTSDEFLALETLPKSLVMVGGGYIGFEFAHTATRVGAKVTVLQRGDRALTNFEPDLVRRLIDKSRRIGIEVHLATGVEGVERTEQGVRVRASSNGQSRYFEAEMAVHAAGRVPAIDELDLKVAGIERDEQGLRLTPQLQSVSNPAVFAAGDAAARGPALTPVAAHDAEVVAANLLEGAAREPDYAGVPSVAFTIPPIASVGMTEAQATAAGLEFRVNQDEMTHWQVVRHEAEDTAAYKVLIEEGSERILGAHLIGPGTVEVINLLALAIRLGIPARQMRRFTSAFPSAASNLFHMIK
jgi:glutathione reductase (NADPH)